METDMTKERGGGLIFLLVGIYGLIFSSTLPLGQWSEPGAGVFPLSVSILLCVSGISWLIAGKPKRGEETAIDWRSMARLMKTPFLTILITAVFVMAMTRIGYLAGSILFLFLVLLFVSHYRLRTAVALGTVLGIGGWLFFVKLLAIQLPTVGIWIF
jgi:putative tricarboxylic transport membrane protein